MSSCGHEIVRVLVAVPTLPIGLARQKFRVHLCKAAIVGCAPNHRNRAPDVRCKARTD